ncbi:ADP-ribosylglycohydrolase [Pseudoramibacter alactolyticus ATCC 23263]|jgi:ADP-ribosylglycohydrolase|uniref:ADP-ribosylglycohydrolase n=1 Tax=Pseudoramibacter alactolyticus ATCC 23263 TaxID=887929 RepID=E6MHB7_9FIRM|nr:ADP-ribosylglycohydrolase family protein [Pseudoramibacter alactolyticus]EFV01481.1 ADP-ribosylglycohydrolase [Pseudoramibacter alactolyticus ATCC 23263]MBM6968575.1 ADP-ribosylglycohydrolase family protein [Pseudoramibacter alactolyticus]
MLGAIIGDIAGSVYEFDRNFIRQVRNDSAVDFPIFGTGSRFTDDSVMTLAVAQGLMRGYGNPDASEREIILAMQHLGRRYPNVGYGGRFIRWIFADDPKPYGSYGNGSAMRVSGAAWLYDSLALVEKYAAISAKVSHDHPEGIKGAQATATAIFLARQQEAKAKIRQYIEAHYGYALGRDDATIRQSNRGHVSCQATVPEAIDCFLMADDFESTIRLAVSLGGDTDTLAAIAGSIAEAYYPMPEAIKRQALSALDGNLKEILRACDVFVADHPPVGGQKGRNMR